MGYLVPPMRLLITAAGEGLTRPPPPRVEALLTRLPQRYETFERVVPYMKEFLERTALVR